ncbi:MAG TPA: hypothetical protein VNV82_22690 [Bryobacteraceae bacterium]|jgi:hypothetical protein|nr:hypothetical protein [Bryobacteraceae bacterium]
MAAKSACPLCRSWSKYGVEERAQQTSPNTTSSESSPRTSFPDSHSRYLVRDMTLQADGKQILFRSGPI